MATYYPPTGNKSNGTTKLQELANNLFISVGDGVKKVASLFGKTLTANSNTLGRNVLIGSSVLFAIGAGGGGKAKLRYDRLQADFALDAVGGGGSHIVYVTTQETTRITNGQVPADLQITVNRKGEGKGTCLKVLGQLKVPRSEWKYYMKLL